MTCSRDTDGDGNCGQPLCPECGAMNMLCVGGPKDGEVVFVKRELVYEVDAVDEWWAPSGGMFKPRRTWYMPKRFGLKWYIPETEDERRRVVYATDPSRVPPFDPFVRWEGMALIHMDKAQLSDEVTRKLTFIANLAIWGLA